VEADSLLATRVFFSGFGGLGGLEHLVLVGEGKWRMKTGLVVVILSGEKEEGNCLPPLDLVITLSGKVGLVC